MPKFSKTSAARLATCDHHLQILFGEVIKCFDCTVACGYRGKANQDAAYGAGKSTKGWPNSKHNRKPSLAVDVYPYINGRISYNDYDAFLFAGKVMGMAAIMNMQGKFRCGADWKGTGDTHARILSDPGHFEVIT